MTLLLVAVASALGAVCRYAVDTAVRARLGGIAPWGTVVVNATGSAALGVLAGLVASSAASTDVHVVLGTGFLGAYTTFSTWMVETVAMVQRGAFGAAFVYGGGSLVAGPLLAGFGYALALWSST
jgi:fluoride exporter